MLGGFVVAERAYRLAFEQCQAAGVGLFCRVRHQNGWTQREMAERLEIDVTYLSKIENGVYLPSRPALLKLAALMELLP